MAALQSEQKGFFTSSLLCNGTTFGIPAPACSKKDFARRRAIVDHPWPGANLAKESL
jgi:hypothetical protein